MGILGSETAFQELLCRVLGDLVQEGVSAKIADDLYVGGDMYLYPYRSMLVILFTFTTIEIYHAHITDTS